MGRFAAEAREQWTWINALAQPVGSCGVERPWFGGDPPDPETVDAEMKIEVPRASGATER